MEQSTAYKFKVVVLGEQTVGKSTLIQRIVSGTARANIAPTIGVEYCTYTLENENALLGIWDTSGDERYRSISNMHYRNADGIILVYDVTNAHSFESLQSVWLRQFKLHLREEEVVLAFVGNKSELPSHAISHSQGQKMAKNNHALFCEVSALKGDRVDEFLVEFTRKMIEKKKNLETHQKQVLDNLRKGSVILDPANHLPRGEAGHLGLGQKEGHCCGN